MKKSSLMLSRRSNTARQKRMAELNNNRFYVGIDVGGNFTDCVLVDSNGRSAVGETFTTARVESVAVSFLFSFLNPEHELRVGELLEKKFPEAYVSLSTQVLPQLRAYERHSTTVLNAYVGPILSLYLGRLTDRLNKAGFAGRLLIMQSNGGVMAPETAARFACRTLLSGPAGGPVAATFYG